MNQTKYNLIYEKLCSAIVAGEYPPGYRFPCEIDFARQLGIGKVTLRRALARLEHDGLIERLPRKGTFVRMPDTKQKRRILAILPEYDDIISPHLYILPGVESECAAAGLELVSVQQDFITGRNFDPKQLGIQGYMGIVLLPFTYQDNDPLFKLVEMSGLPGVIAHCVRRRYAGCNMAVLSSSQEAWTDAVKHLTALGHRRIATLVTDSSRNFCRYMRTEEFENFLQENGAGESVPLIRHIDYYDNGALRKVLEEQLGENPTAILCHSDFVALKVYDFLRERKLRIPQDIAVMGYCGFPGAALLTPPLSTVDLNYARRGRLAVQLLLDSAKWFGRGEPPFIELSHSLLLRESTAQIEL